MVLFTSLGVKLKIWRGPTSEKCGRNYVGSHFEIGRSRNWQSDFTYDNFKPKELFPSQNPRWPTIENGDI